MTMKKLFLLAACLLTGLATASAQNSSEYLPDGILALEWKFNPFDYEDKPANMSQITARLFLDEKSTVRLTAGFGYRKDKNDEQKSIDSRPADPNNYDVEKGGTVTNNKEMSLKVGVGYEYHFASSGRLDFYGGVEGGYLGRFYSATKETVNNKVNVSTVNNVATTTRTNTYENYDYKKSNADRTKFNENGFFGTVFTGIDWYVYRKLYIGAELAVTFNTGKKKNGTYTKSSGSQIIVGPSETENWSRNYNSETGITTYVDNLNKNNNRTEADYVLDNTGTFTKVYIEPAIRIGWMF